MIYNYHQRRHYATNNSDDHIVSMSTSCRRYWITTIVTLFLIFAVNGNSNEFTVAHHQRRLGEATSTNSARSTDDTTSVASMVTWFILLLERFSPQPSSSESTKEQVDEYDNDTDENKFQTKNLSGTVSDNNHQIIVRFDLNENENIVLTREEIETKAQQVASQLGGTVLQIYEHIFYGAAIGNLPSTSTDTTTTTTILSEDNSENESSGNSKGNTYRTFVRHSNNAASPTTDVVPTFTYEMDMQIGKRYQLSSSEVTEEDDGNKIQVQEYPPEPLDRINQKKLPLDHTYKYKYNGTGVTVFVVDTGIRTTHVEFSQTPSITCGYTAFPDDVVVATSDNGNDCDDLNGHGTHVAGTIASQTYGVAKGVNLVAVKVLDKDGNGSYTSLLGGIEYMIQQKLANPSTPMVANLSLAGSKSDFLNDAVQNAINNNIVMVVSAGNDSTDACNLSPASLAPAITVGASVQTSSSSTNQSFFTRMFNSVLRKEKQAAFSNYGSCVDILTWGVMVKSLGIDSPTSVALKTGTSMATPHVTGAVALYLSRDPYMTPKQIHETIIADASKAQLRLLSQNGSPNRILNTENIM